MFCYRCGKANEDDNRFCKYCGTMIRPPAVVVPEDLNYFPPNPDALWAYYLGIASLLCGITGIPAIGMGIRGLRYAKLHPEARGEVHAWVGIIGGALTVLCVFMLIIGVVISACL